MRTKIAVVILNWNTRALLEQFLPLVLEHSCSVPDVHIIVADNFSTDDSVAYMTEKHPEVRLICLDKNYGFAGGYNHALELVDAEYFLLLNSDIETTPNWLEPLLSIIEKDTNIAAVVPKIKSQLRKSHFEHAGAAGGYIDKFGFPFCAGRIFDEIEEDTGQYDQERSIFWGSGASLMIRADLWRSAGGLDSDFFAHMEEIDLCWRLKNEGYKIWYCPQSTVFHVGGGTLPETSPFKLYLNFRNNLFLLYKNLPSEGFRSILFKRMLFDGVAGIKFVCSGQFRSFGAVLKAHFHFYRSLASVKEKRRLLQKVRLVDNHQEVFNQSIVMQFFVKQKRLFSQLPFIMNR